MRWCYWDDTPDSSGDSPAKMAEDLTGIKLVKKRNMEDNKPRRKHKKSRVDDLLASFRTLSQIEKENFVNAIRNFVVHGKL
jgi:hypothetical protein